MAESASDITGLLNQMAGGDKQAEARVFEALHPELKKVAAACMRSERPDHTLQPTALVNEAYMRIVSGPDRTWHNRTHFLAVAAQIMRYFLVDYAKARLAQKRGGGAKHFPLDTDMIGTNYSYAELIELHEALERYAVIDDRGARVVELRFFGGLTVEETADVLGKAPKTIKRDWAAAKAWLYNELKGNPGSDAVRR